MRTLTSRKRIWLAVGRRKGERRALRVVARDNTVRFPRRLGILEHTAGDEAGTNGRT